MVKLAVKNLRAGSVIATLVALAAGVMILMSMGTLVESGLRYHPEPHKYAHADVVVAHQNITFTSKDFDGETTSETLPLPEGGRLPADLAGKIRGVPGVTAVEEEPDAIAVTGAGIVEPVRRLAKEAGVEAYTGNDRGLLEQPEGAATRSLLIQIGGSFGGYVVLLIIFVVAGTVGLSVRHRRRDLALLRAVAATPGQVRRMIVAESALLGVVASVLGVPAGVFATGWVHDQLAARGFLPSSFPMSHGVVAAAAAVGLTVLVAVCAALIAARRVTAIRPAEALGEISIEPARSGKVRLVFGLLTLAGAVTASTFAVSGSGEAALTGALGMLYLFVLAVALLAPWINAFAARLLTPVLRATFGTSGYLAAANLRANSKGMATVLTALVLSVGFGGSVWFLQNNLERGAAHDRAEGVLADFAMVAPGGLPPAAAEQTAAIPGVRAVTAIRRTAVLVKVFDGAEQVEAQAIDPRSASGTLDLGVREGSLQDLTSTSIAVSRMRAGTQNWKIGDEVGLWLGDGTPITVRVAAIYDRGLGFGDVTLNRETVAGHTRTGRDDQLLISTDDGSSLAPAAARYPGSSIVSAAGLNGKLAKDLALGAWLNRLLIGVMVGYAALAAANTMIMAALARRRELSLLRLVGVTRRQIKNMVHAEQAGLLGVALVVGVAIAGATLTAVVHSLTGDPVPYIPPLGWVTVLGGATLLALVATILPIGRLLRVSPLEHLGTKE
ncbi:hypothetical protein Ahu01nite_025930 [Winogradskya humida]|uniref:ABC3 transporter permease C-terminal domain-containing protein n=1 Tax=Winogradskya humida TaxID=113566 RepID=A0ABQ3ZLM9_9ACTN|nr:hypothetical protein Ahu01nite_025930 [Actinoplanes humidus]